jgi:serine/threonine-protein kinase
MALGTPLYMAPEVITSGEATPASDVYALALLAYTMLAGRHPFAHEDRAGMFTRQVNEVPQAADLVNPALSPRVSAVLKRALEKSPQQRFATAAELVDALAVATGLTPTDPRDTLDGENPFNQAPTVIASRETRIERTPDRGRGPLVAPIPPVPERVTEPDRPPLLSAQSNSSLDGPTDELQYAATHIDPAEKSNRPVIFIAVGTAVLLLALALWFALR